MSIDIQEDLENNKLIVSVTLSKRKFVSQKEYHAVHCVQNGLPVALLLTQNQLDDAVKRAKENQEDIPEI